MKYIALMFVALISNALLAGSLDQPSQPVGAEWYISGKVISVTGEGVLVICDFPASAGHRKPKKDEVVFVRGLNGIDGDKVKTTALMEGAYQYQAVSGALSTVRAFSAK